MLLGIDVRNAISWFASSLIAGNHGPDDSRYSRDRLFRKHPGVVGQAISIFLYRLEMDKAGRVLNHEERRGTRATIHSMENLWWEIPRTAV
jgi:hypothetical protein